MRLLNVIRLSCVLCMFLGGDAASARAQTTPSKANQEPLPADFDRLAEIFAKIGTPNAKGKSLVVAELKSGTESYGVEGWLIEDGPNGITIYDWTGITHKARRPKPGEKPLAVGTRGTDELVAWGLKTKSFLVASKRTLAEGLREIKELRGDADSKRFTLISCGVAFARLAIFAHQLGHADHASDLYAAARKVQKAYADAFGGDAQNAALPAFVANGLADWLRDAVIYACEAQAKRDDIQKQWEAVAALADHQRQDEAREMVRLYQSLLDEDRRWVEPDADAVKKMTTEQKANYWLYHLRNQNYCKEQFGQVGRPMERASRPGPNSIVFFGPSTRLDADGNPYPTSHLEDLGVAAIPLLIAHLDDMRPTRCYRDKSSQLYLVRYGDLCQQVFEAISLRTIYSGKYPMTSSQIKERKANAERWWCDYQKKGEKQMLIDGTAAGGPDSIAQAERLADKFPNEALAAIRLGARASKDLLVRAILIQIADQLFDRNVLRLDFGRGPAFKDDRPVPFLREELDGPYPETRLEAAMALMDRGDSAGAKALQKEWKQFCAKSVDRYDNDTLLNDVLRAVIALGEPDAIHSVSELMPQYGFQTRRDIIQRAAAVRRDFRNAPLSAEALRAIEDLLVKALDDSEEESPDSSLFRGWCWPMLADRAAIALAELWEQPKRLDVWAKLQSRENKRVELKNLWLVKRGKTPLPVPSRKVTPASETTLQPLIAAVLDSKTSAESKQALRSFEDLGLPGLPALRTLDKLVGALETPHPARSEVQTVAQRMAMIVREVRITADSIKPGDAFLRKLDLLKGKPINEKAFTEILNDVDNVLQAGASGITMRLERIPDGSGVYVAVSLLPVGPHLKVSTPVSAVESGPVCLAEYGGGIILAKKFLGGGFSSCTTDRPFVPSNGHWAKFKQDLRSALKAPPNQYLYVQAHWVRSR